ncbi:hypothetical protein [Streptomyces sp. ICN441]|nr:hypothetical protein [Streptomyces sp. ICN441]
MPERKGPLVSSVPERKAPAVSSLLPERKAGAAGAAEVFAAAKPVNR